MRGESDWVQQARHACIATGMVERASNNPNARPRLVYRENNARFLIVEAKIVGSTNALENNNSSSENSKT